MRNKRIVATATGVALTGIIASGAFATSSALATPPVSHPAVHHAVAPKVDPASALATAGSTGKLLGAVGDLSGLAKSGAKPDASAVKTALKAVQDAGAKITGSAKQTAPVTAGLHPQTAGRDLPVPVPVPGVGSLKDAVGKVLTDAKALSDALLGADASKVAPALTQLATDVLGVLTATVSALGGLPKV